MARRQQTTHDEGGASFRRPRIGLSTHVADLLRSRILSGTLAEGDLLPKQEELVAEYGVSRPGVRAALHILEAEGLIEVRHGNIGGAVVHIPQPEGAAYTLGLVLEARQVPFTQVQKALNLLEPMCAGLCAELSNRRRTIVPALRSSQDSLRSAINADDASACLTAIREFHEAIVRHCGNEVLIVLVGTLEALWTSQAQSTGHLADGAGNYQDPALRREVEEAHEEILHHIAGGAADLATKASRSHLETARLRRWPAPVTSVHATAVRDHFAHPPGGAR